MGWEYGGNWGPGPSGSGFQCMTRARIDVSTQVVSDTVLRVTVTGETASGDGKGHYRLADWTVNCRVGYNNGNESGGSAKYNYENWVGRTSKSWDFTRGASAQNVTVFFRYWTNSGSMNGRVSKTITIPQRGYSKPKPPKSFALEYSSDTSQKLTWQGDYTGMDGAYPWYSVHVDRRTDGGKWTTIANLGWSAVNYTDNSTEANHRYDYRLFAKGAGGTSSYTSEQTVYTTPAAPASVSLSKVIQTNVRVSADVSGVRTATAYEVETNLNDGGWSGNQSVPGFPVTVDLGGGKAVVRVRSTRGALKSDWVESAPITTIMPPLAPSVTVAQGVVMPQGTDPVIRWSPNHPDGSVQTAAQVQLTRGSQPPTVEDVAGDATEYVAKVGAVTGSYTVRVRTKGIHSDWGEWSQAVSFAIAVPPTGFFTSPATDDAVVAVLPLSLAWEVTDATGVAKQSLRISTPDGTNVIVRELPTGARTLDIGLSDGLVDKTAYTATLDVRGGSGLPATFSRAFETKYNGPAEPVVSVATGDGLSAEIKVDFGSDVEGTRPDTVTAEVSRVDQSGTTLVASGLLSGQTAIDKLPPLNVPVEYVVTATSDIGTVTEVRVGHVVDSQGFEAYNFGRAAERCYLLGYDASGDESVEHSGEAFYFALGPDAPNMPTFYMDGDMAASGRHSYSIVDGALYASLRAESRRRGSGLCWFRSAFGGRAFCRVGVSLGYDASDYGVFKASMSLEESVWEEPANA